MRALVAFVVCILVAVGGGWLAVFLGAPTVGLPGLLVGLAVGLVAALAFWATLILAEIY